ncbi:dihydroorotase [Lachnoclostridium sp. Marseille-P6806]|uniref:dihydroorotase n=1 Tax=Lachnoclostridium sp. Marseille-P6806 TaxID=2364793 RepID=UPI001031F33D|nr:dihydroorotase [Lachnoclostridium sp. Marseille-P6806]
MLIRSARVCDPAGGIDSVMDILIRDGRIAAMGPALPCPPGEEIIEAAGLLAAPGLIDTHSHFRDPGFPLKEDIFSGAAAAARGGYTSVIMMANTKPPIDNPGTLRSVLKKGAETPVHIYSCANVTKGMSGEDLTDFRALSGAGAVGFTDDGRPITDAALLREALEEAAALDLPVSLHEEDPAHVRHAGVNAGGAAAAALGLIGADREAERVMVERDIRLALETGADVVIQHISAKESVELVRRGRALSPRIHAEATPHHFSLTEDAVIKKGTAAKCNPPIRTEEDRLAIIEGLRDGTIDMIATDHAPHTAGEKAMPFPEAPSGMIGLETAFSLGLRELVNKGYLSLMDLLRLMTVNPAELYHLPAGRLAVEAAADLMLCDLHASWVVSEPFASRASNSPFLGETLPGVIRCTIAGGRIAFRRDG